MMLFVPLSVFVFFKFFFSWTLNSGASACGPCPISGEKQSKLYQKCVLAPSLFSVCMDWIMRRTQSAQAPASGTSFGDERFPDLNLADDTLIFAEAVEILVVVASLDVLSKGHF